MTDRGPNPLVSVVIPCFNQGQFLGAAIRSAIAQDQAPNVVVVDDGSTDDTAAVASGFSGVRLLLERNEGTAAARNHGLRASAGRFVVFLDADDRLLPGALAAGVAALSADPAYGFVYGHVRVVGPDPGDCRCPTQTTVDREHYRALLAGNYVWTPGAVMYRREALETVGGFDPRAGGSADYDLNIRIARRWPVRCHGKLVLDYREHPDSQSGDLAYMLRSAVWVRRRHRRVGRLSREERAALAGGIRTVQADYGERLLDRMALTAREGAWWAALCSLPPLLRYHPAGLGRRLVRQVRPR